MAEKQPKTSEVGGINGSMDMNVEKIAALNIKKQYINNTELCRFLGTNQLNISDNSFNLNLKIKEREINFIIKLWTANNTLSDQNISQYDIAVMDAAYTIMRNGLMMITPEMVVHVISGNKRVQITKKKINAVMASFHKLQFVRIKIDCTEEYNAYQLQKGREPVKFRDFESALLPLEKVEDQFNAKGKKVIAYKILEKPALNRYAEMNKQIVDVPAYLLETVDHFSDTFEAILIKRYVIKRVAQIVQGSNLNNNKVSFLWFDKSTNQERGVFPELGYTPDSSPAWRKKKARIIKIVCGTLETLVEGNAIIKYEEYRKDGTNNPTSPIMGYKVYYSADHTTLRNKLI